MTETKTKPRSVEKTLSDIQRYQERRRLLSDLDLDTARPINDTQEALEMAGCGFKTPARIVD